MVKQMAAVKHMHHGILYIYKLCHLGFKGGTRTVVFSKQKANAKALHAERMEGLRIWDW